MDEHNCLSGQDFSNTLKAVEVVMKLGSYVKNGNAFGSSDIYDGLLRDTVVGFSAQTPRSLFLPRRGESSNSFCETLLPSDAPISCWQYQTWSCVITEPA